MRMSEGITDPSPSGYEDMTRGRRNTSFSSRISKTVSLDFPPPPMSLFTNPIFPQSSARCVMCVNLFSHFSLRCRGCSKPVCCICAHQSKKCKTCKLSYHHPDNIIERNESYISYDPDYQHECVVSSLKNRVSYFNPHGDSHSNNCFLLKIKFCLDLITNECIEGYPAFAKTILTHVLEAFHREPVIINLKEAFDKWKPTDRFVSNLIAIDFSEETRIPVHSDYSCVSPSGRFLFLVKSVEDTTKRRNEIQKPRAQGISLCSCKLIKTCIFTFILTAIFLICFMFDFHSYR